MTEAQSLALIDLIRRGWPSHPLGEGTVELYARGIADLDYADARSGFEGLIKRWGKFPAWSNRLPQLGELREAARFGAMQVIGFTPDELDAVSSEWLAEMSAAHKRTGRWPDDVCGSADLAPGARVRHRRHHDLTGRVKCYEWESPGRLSGIPYNIEWDNNTAAADRLGWLWIYASDETVEAISEGE